MSTTNVTPQLSDRHRDELHRLGISDTTIAENSIYTESDPAAVAELLNWSATRAGALRPVLVYPHYDQAGEPMGHAVVKPDSPRPRKDKPEKVVKYENPRGRPNRLYIPAGARAALADPAAPLLATEGCKKALAATQHGFPCVSVQGTWNWCVRRPRRNRRAYGPFELIPDLAAVAWAGRRAFVVFDSDAATNPGVRRAERALVDALIRTGAVVRLVRLPAAPDGAKQGLDDFLVVQGVGALRTLLDQADADTATADAAPPRKDSGAAVFADPAELDRLARLSVEDPAAFARERALLKTRGASVRDLDRAIADRVEALRAERREAARSEPDKAPPPYFVADGRIYRRVTSRDGTVETPLCNFAARITADVSVDDGAERRRVFRLDGRLDTGEPLGEVEVPADQFSRMDWVTAAWGVRATVNAGMGTKDHLRAALQILSGDVPGEVVFAHTGWREVGGAWAFLHAGGAVGGDGAVPGVRVGLPPQLAGYALPDPPSGDRLRTAVRASLAVFGGKLAPDAAAVVVLVAPYRAVGGGADYSLGLFGKTGAGKSELAALAQQHFGPMLDARHLPGNWSSTGNALESLAFHAKDALLVVDDYCPDNQDPRRLARDADRLLRGQGNQSGRNRLTADATLRPSKPPRGLVLMTGEDIPTGTSLRARLWSAEVASGSVAFARLTECQRDAAAGLYAAALAGFVGWLAPSYPARRDGLRAEAVRLRGGLGVGGHSRVPTVAADLLAAFGLLMEFATAVGAITPAEARRYTERAKRAILATAAAQAEHQRDSDPAERFPALLRSALSSGRAHLARRDGTPPEDDDAPAAGWRKVEGAWAPLGKRVGWLDGDRILLDPDSAFAEARRLADEQGSGFSVSQRTLWRLMHEAGRLADVDRRSDRLRYTLRRTAEGSQRDVVLLPACLLISPAESVQSGQYYETPTEIGRFPVDTLLDTGHSVADPRVATSAAGGHSPNGECPGASRTRAGACDGKGHTGHSAAGHRSVARDNHPISGDMLTEEVL
jgi:hypothetical protein